MDYKDIRMRLSTAYTGLSPELRKAANYVMENPEQVGLNSMRGLSARAGVQPATMLRMIRRLDCQGYKEFSKPYKDRLLGRDGDYANRARSLQTRGREGSVGTILKEGAASDAAAIDEAFRANGPDRFAAFCAAIEDAPRLFVVGLRGSYSLAFAFAYAYRMIRSNAVLLDSGGLTIADVLRGLEKSDTLLAIGFAPYSDMTLKAVDYTLAKGGQVLAITDSVTSPLATRARHSLIVADDSPSVVQSFVASLAVIQALVSLLVSRGGDSALSHIKKSELQLASFAAYQPTGKGRHPRRNRK